MPEEGGSRRMETASGDLGRLSPEEAVEEIERIDGLHDALEQRTSGVTWMVWGIASAAIFVTYSYVGVVVDAYAPEASALFPFLWIPWVVLGVLATRSLWRSAGLVVPIDRSAIDREGVLLGLLFVVLITAGIRGVDRVGVALLEPAIALAGVGAATGLMGLIGLTTTSRFERKAATVAGALVVLVALVTSALVPPDGTGYAWLSLVAPVTVALAYFTVGGLVASRG